MCDVDTKAYVERASECERYHEACYKVSELSCHRYSLALKQSQQQRLEHWRGYL